MAESSRWIAIVDDDPAVLKALARLLRIRDLHARIFGSAREFLAALHDGWPDCLILDLQMPEMTGLELLQQLRRGNIQIPTIIVTAHADGAVRARCESAGVFAFLSKPLQESALLAAIEAAGKTPKGTSLGR